ncbi:MAG: glycosyltransferase family 2 protein [Muribaculaceae bacterium]|nr:glycosyltransferase family 2 protein [Muribaculaceae bacterium]
MKHKVPVTAIVHTYNSAQYLDEVLTALADFDEILVLDMESTDDTVAIAQRHGARVIVKERGEHRIAEAYRDFAIHAATHEWVFVVDSDEIVPPALAQYVFDELDRDSSPRGVMVPRKNYFMGHWMRSTYPDFTIRLFPKEGAHWPYAIHSMPTHAGPTVYIPQNRSDLALIHLAGQDMHSMLAKTNDYTSIESRRRRDRYSPWKFIYDPPFRFFKSYVLKGGFRDGLPGFVQAVNDAIYRFTTLAKIQNDENAERHDTDLARDRRCGKKQQ